VTQGSKWIKWIYLQQNRQKNRGHPLKVYGLVNFSSKRTARRVFSVLSSVSKPLFSFSEGDIKYGYYVLLCRWRFIAPISLNDPLILTSYIRRRREQQ
jgi:hypothetical protein